MKPNFIISLLILIAFIIVGYFVVKSNSSEDYPEKTDTVFQGKINIDEVCQGALAYMSFPDSASAEIFVEECKEGKHPQVIEAFKAQMNVGDGAAI